MKKIILQTILSILSIAHLYGQNYTITYGPLAEIAGTGTSVTMTSSASSAALPIGFDFTFWENTYTEFYINPSGAIQFGVGSATGLSDSNPSNRNSIISTNLPNNFIAFAWAGGSNVTSANINYFVFGNAPNRILVINFKNATQTGYSWPSPDVVNVQLQLYEGPDGKIEIHHTDNNANCKGTQFSGNICLEKMIGIENSTGTKGRPVTNTTSWSKNNSMTRLVYCPTNVPKPTEVTPNISSCGAPGTINLTANCSVGTPVWYNSNQSPLLSTTVNPTSYSSYLVRCEDNICASDYAVTIINITTTPPAPTVTKSPNTATNPGVQVTLTTSGCPYGTLNWSDGLSQVNNYAGSIEKLVYPTTTTTYKVTCTISGCLGPEGEITTEVLTPPNITATTPTSFCSGGTITLAATGCAAVEVNWPDGTHGLTWTSPALTSNATSDKSYSYTATCTKSGVTTVASNTITARALVIPPTPSVASATVNNIAPGTSVGLTATCTNVYYWYWNDGTTDRVSPRSTYLTDTYYVNPTITTDYYAGTQNGDCFSPRLKVTVHVLPPVPTITATSATTFEAGGTVSLTATGCESPKVVSWHEATEGNTGATGLTYTSPALNANNTTMTSKVYTYSAKCSDGVNTSASSNNVPVTVTFKFGTITIDNTTPTLICGAKGTIFYVDFTKTGSFANTYTTVELYEKKEFVGTNIYNTLLETSGTNTNRAPFGLNKNLEASHGGGNPNLTYYILVKNGTVSATWPITISIPATPIISVSGTLPITTIGQSITLNTAPEAGISKQWYKGNINQLSGETNDFLTISPEETAYYSVKSTDLNGCSMQSAYTKLPIVFTLTGTGTVADKTYTEGALEYDFSFACTGCIGNRFPGPPSQSISEKYYDTGTHFYNILIDNGGQYNQNLKAYFVYRENNIWGIYYHYITFIGSGANQLPVYHFDRLFHTKNPFPTIPGARLAADPNAITNTVPPANAVWINDATGEEVNLALTGATEIQTVLPLTLISFTGNTTEKGNKLTWKTTHEKDFSHFEIQKSMDAKKFEKIGEVKGAKNEIYEYVDNSSLVNHNLSPSYYRLKMVDLDGTFTFSKIIFIEDNSAKPIVGNFYPNPATSNEVFIDIQAIEDGNWNVKNFEITGKLIESETKFLKKGSNKVKMDLSKGSFGNRYIQIESNGILEIRKILKE